MKFKLLLFVAFAVSVLWILTTAVLAQEELPPSYAGLKNPFPWTDGTAQEAGKELYQVTCLPCHGASGGNIAGANFASANYTGRLEESPDRSFWLLSEGSQDKGMPAYKFSLSEEQRWQVLTYLWSLSKEGASTEIAGPIVINPVSEEGVLPDCFRCHTRVLKGHDKLGEGSGACLICHSGTHMGMLRLFDGTELSPEDSPKLCGQCHSAHYAAWQEGTHGIVAGREERTGLPIVVKPKCADCHEPHQPQMSLAIGKTYPPLSAEGGQLDCLSCHVRVLKGHDKLGEGSEACWACHVSTQMKTLHLAGGETRLPLSDSPKLCAQCHQARYEAWERGTHGVPAWKEGEPAIVGADKVKCINCHEPHQPQIPLLNITKPHPPAQPPPAKPSALLLALLGISGVLVVAVGLAVVRRGELP
ncbi:MAG: c-type cytochrome [Dehalococcoidales bacterium]|nr:c-type cytochrome [Dehalococcoidales bacterium]